MTKTRQKGRSSKQFSSHDMAMLQTCNALLTSIEEELPVTELHVAFSEKRCFLNGLFSNNSIHCMLEGKDYQCIGKLFLFITGYADSGRSYRNKPKLTEIYTSYSKLDGNLCSDRGEVEFQMNE